MAKSLIEMFQPREDLVKRLNKCLERVEPERHLFIVTSWMSMEQLEELVKFQENNPI